MADDDQQELTPEQLFEQIRQLKVSDLLLSTITTLAQVGYAKLDESSRDLEQAQVSIEAIRALLPLVEPHVPGELSRDLGQMVANLQLAYAGAATEQPRPESPPG